MRKNLLPLMFGFSFLFFGMLVTGAEASTNSLPNSVRTNKNEFNKKIVKLKALCKTSVGPNCDSAIAAADWAATLGNICMADMSECQGAQDAAINILNIAMDICRMESEWEYPQSSIKRRKNILKLSVNEQEDA